VDPDSPREVSQVIAGLLNDRKQMLRLGEEGRASVLKRYTWDRVAEGLLNIFEKQLLIDRNA
jgi:glycosyltransferase involved in cell wall biosynthesis